MASVFDTLDWPFPIRAVPQETPFYNSEGVQTFPATVSVSIKGHVSTYTRSDAESEWHRQVAGVYEDGDIRFFTETVLKKGQTVEIERTSVLGERVDKYRVISMVREHRIMSLLSGGSVRYEYCLREVSASGPTIT